MLPFNWVRLEEDCKPHMKMQGGQHLDFSIGRPLAEDTVNPVIYFWTTETLGSQMNIVFNCSIHGNLFW